MENRAVLIQILKMNLRQIRLRLGASPKMGHQELRALRLALSPNVNEMAPPIDFRYCGGILTPEDRLG
jgi:hypothetical protein